MAINKIEAFGETLIDLTGDTVTPETLAQGVTAHNAAGKSITGIMSTDSGNNNFRVTATANLTSDTGGILTDISHSFAEIEAAKERGECVYLDIDISQMSQNQRVNLCLVSYMDSALLIFGGSIYTGEMCMQLTCILTVDGNSPFYINQLATIEDLAGLGGGADNTFVVTGYGSVSMDNNGNINLSVSNISHTYSEIIAAYNSGKNISLVADTNTSDKMHLTLVSVNAASINFTCAAHAGTSFMFVGIGINSDDTITAFNKMI